MEAEKIHFHVILEKNSPNLQGDKQGVGPDLAQQRGFDFKRNVNRSNKGSSVLFDGSLIIVTARTVP